MPAIGKREWLLLAVVGQGSQQCYQRAAACWAVTPALVYIAYRVDRKVVLLVCYNVAMCQYPIAN